jgi:hypothetical protein
MTWAPGDVIPDPYVPTDWRECGACHARKPGVCGDPPRCRLCRALRHAP